MRAPGWSSVDRTLHALAIVATLVSVSRPFWAAKYPPITDLPFHASETSVFRHYGDPSFHFREQFELQPFAVPYLSSYLLGAALMLVLPTVPAVKLATSIMLLALPAGLATLAWGMRKSPLLGLAGLPLVWSNLTQWGFINFVAALGFFAAALGLTLRVLDRPSRRTTGALAVVLVLVLVTHVFRYPFALLATLGTTALAYPLRRRVRPVLIAVAPSLLLFAVFWRLRPAELAGHTELAVETARVAELPGFLIGSFTGDGERQLMRDHTWVLGVVALGSLATRLFEERARLRRLGRAALAARAPRRARLARSIVARAAFGAIATGATAMCALGFLAGFLTLPMQIGDWWYIYPREALATVFIALGLLPDLPRGAWARALAVVALSFSGLRTSAYVAEQYASFDAVTRDFDAISREIPPAPKLLYLMFDRSGSSRGPTALMHLPAYVQAEKGGWLSFHFAVWGTSPIRYRSGPGAVVPPPVPRRWEWTPQAFDVREHGPFFDWFLIRSETDPSRLLRADRSIHLVDHQGTWWLYQRRLAGP
ncbi:MAG: hypothetical protein U0271_16725 [Polyangiaceae bacterium]